MTISARPSWPSCSARRRRPTSRRRSSSRRSRRPWSSPAPGRARPRRWPPGWSGWSPTGWCAPDAGARADLHPQGGGRAGRAHPPPACPVAARSSSATAHDDARLLAELLAGEPTVLTYAAYAGRLVAEHALRLGAESRVRGCSRRRCAGSWPTRSCAVRRRAARRHRGAGVRDPARCLGLADQLADHLVAPDEVDGFCATALAEWDRLPSGSARSATPKATGGYVKAQRDRLALLPLVRAFAAAKDELGGVDFADQMALAARSREVPRSRSRAGAVLGGAARRVPGHRARSGRDAGGSVRRRASRSPRSAIRSSRSTAGAAPAPATSAGSRRCSRTPTDRPAIVFPLATSWRNDERSWPRPTSSHAAVTATERAASRAAGPSRRRARAGFVATMHADCRGRGALACRRLRR